MYVIEVSNETGTADHVRIEEGNERINGIDTDTCDYYFYY